MDMPRVPRPAIAATLIAALAVIAVWAGITVASGDDSPAAKNPVAAGTGSSSTRGTPSSSSTPTKTRTNGRKSGGGPSDSASASGTKSTKSTTRPKPEKTGPTPRQLRRAALRGVSRISSKQPSGAVSVAALNTATGARFVAGERSGMWTASAYKLLVLETLLMQNGGPLTGSEASYAIPMIEQSDNSAAWVLYQDAGGRGALVSALARFGMRHTIPGSFDPTLTTTSGADYLHLLENLVDKNSPLTKASRDYALNLMRNVEADQRWGVGVTADKHSTFYNKNGWLSIDNSNPPGETDNGLWAVTSVGIVRIHGQQVLMAVFTRHQPDMETGVRLVQKLARTIAPAVAHAE